MTAQQPGAGPAPGTEPARPGRERTRQAGRAVGSGAKAAGRGVAGAARMTGRAGRATLRQARRGAEAEGAGQSGLSRLIELHAFNAAGDAAVAISLAGTLFFQVPTGEARGQVALFLGLTMLPFAIVAPLIGPFLDRFAHGRRWAIGSTMAIRGLLCLALAERGGRQLRLALPGRAGLPGRLQGVRRDQGRRRPAARSARASPW